MVVCAVPIGAAGHRIQSDYVKSRFHFSTIRKNIFLWVEECERLVTSVCGSRATASKDDTLTRSAVDGF